MKAGKVWLTCRWPYFRHRSQWLLTGLQTNR